MADEKSQEKPESLLEEAEQLLREVVEWGLESPENLAELSEVTKGPLTPETVNALARLTGRVQALKALRGDPKALAWIAAAAEMEARGGDATTYRGKMNNAQRQVLSGTWFVLAAIAIILLVYVLTQAPDTSARVAFALIIGVPAVLLFAAGFYVRAGGKE
jgi:hypothetical protein